MAYLQLLARLALLAARRAFKAWPVALAVVVYAVAMAVGGMIFGRLGLAGGFLVGLLETVCIASYLHLLSLAVAGSKLQWQDLWSGVGSFFNDVIGILFLLWIAGWAVGSLSNQAGDHAPFVMAAYGLLVAVFLNPVPEIIYQGRSPGRSLELVAVSFRFIQSHWIEWFLPNVALAFALVALVYGPRGVEPRELMVLLPSLFSLEGAYLLAPSLAQGGALWTVPLVLALAHYAMVFRGLLFQELAGGGWRARRLRSFGR
ncbi:MAG: hypothetical protein ACYCWW_07150 [Deltaproteobacteria bacterium]